MSKIDHYNYNMKYLHYILHIICTTMCVSMILDIHLFYSYHLDFWQCGKSVIGIL